MKLWRKPKKTDAEIALANHISEIDQIKMAIQAQKSLIESLNDKRHGMSPGGPIWVDPDEEERIECSRAWKEGHALLCGQARCSHKNPYAA